MPTPERKESTARWATRFIQTLAEGQDKKRHDLDDLSARQKRALVNIVSDALQSRKSTVRRAAAWITGCLDTIPADAPSLLTKLVQDRVALVRMAAAWACCDLASAGAESVPALIKALQDPDNGVQFAAVNSLQKLGDLSVAAVDPLLSVARSTGPERIRVAALMALGDIAPNDSRVQKLLAEELESSSDDQRFAAAYAAARVDNASEGLLKRLSENLESADPYLCVVTAWALGKAQGNDDVSERLLTALKHWRWLQIEYAEEPGQEYVDIRPVFQETLQKTLSKTDDQAYEDFRIKFFMHVFRPSPPEDDSWIGELVTHPWYLKIQRRRFGRPASAHERNAIRELVHDAQAKFAIRIRKNPTLGVQPKNFKLLPGFIKRHTRNIAWRLRQQQENARKLRSRAASPDLPARIDAESVAESNELREWIETGLSQEERDVARCLWVLDLSLRETAQLLGLTLAKVRTRQKNARQKVQARYK